MKNKKVPQKDRNWLLVFICIILILIGLALVITSILYVGDFGWWSLFFGFSGLMTISAAMMSIVKNDPAWILLDLILPG